SLLVSLFMGEKLRYSGGDGMTVFAGEIPYIAFQSRYLRLWDVKLVGMYFEDSTRQGASLVEYNILDLARLLRQRQRLEDDSILLPQRRPNDQLHWYRQSQCTRTRDSQCSNRECNSHNGCVRRCSPQFIYTYQRPYNKNCHRNSKDRRCQYLCNGIR